MMKNWKRIAALAMSAVMAGAMLTGCGGGGKTTEAAKGNEPKAEAGAQAGKDAGEAADSGEKKQVYVFIRDRGDLSYWDSMAAGGDRAVADYADRADVHVVETTADLQANLQAMYEAADKGADLIITASDFKDNLVEVANEYPDIAFTTVSYTHLDVYKRQILITDEVAKKYNFEIDASRRVRDMSVGMKQKLEILKILYRSAKLIILDEPTAVLTPQETEELFERLMELKAVSYTHLLRGSCKI